MGHEAGGGAGERTSGRLDVARLDVGRGPWGEGPLALDVPSSTLLGPRGPLSWLALKALGAGLRGRAALGWLRLRAPAETPGAVRAALGEAARLVRSGAVTLLDGGQVDGSRKADGPGRAGPPAATLSPEAVAAQPVNNLSLGIATECNLRCLYCFGREHGGPDGVFYREARGRMSPEVGRRAVDFLFERSQGERRLTLNLFGGEPLLNLEVVDEVAARARARAAAEGRQVDFALTTNGTLLDAAAAEALQRRGILPMVSLDGPAFVQDATRPFPDGRGSYGVVAENARRLLSSGWQLMARATLSRECLSYVEVARGLIELGFKRLHITAMSRCNPDYCYAPSDYPVLAREFSAFCDFFLEGVLDGRFADHYFGPLDHLMGDLYRRRGGQYGCSAGLSGLYVSPGGGLYPCFRLVAPAFRLGSVLDGFDGAGRAPFFEAAVDRRPGCAGCWARYLCRGECIGDNFFENGDFRRPTALRCGLIRHYVQEAARCLATLSAKAPELLARRYPVDLRPICE